VRHGHQALLTQGTHQAIEGHGSDVADHRTPFQTEPAVGGQQGVTGHVRPHRAVAQDEVWQDGEDRLAGGALDAPDGEPTQTDPRVMGVAREAPAAMTGRLVEELKAKGQEESQHQLDKDLAIAKQPKVGGFVVEIDGDRAVVACRFRCVSHLSPPWRLSLVLMRDHAGNPLKYQVDCERPGTLPLNAMECGLRRSSSRWIFVMTG